MCVTPEPRSAWLEHAAMPPRIFPAAPEEATWLAAPDHCSMFHAPCEHHAPPMQVTMQGRASPAFRASTWASKRCTLPSLATCECERHGSEGIVQEAYCMQQDEKSQHVRSMWYAASGMLLWHATCRKWHAANMMARPPVWQSRHDVLVHFLPPAPHI